MIFVVDNVCCLKKKKKTGAVSIAADPLACLDSAMFAHDQQSCGRTKRWRLGDRRGNSMSAGEDFSVVVSLHLSLREQS